MQEQQRPFDLAQERYNKAIEKSLERIERTYDSTMKSSIKTFSVAEDIKLRDQAQIIDRRVELTNRARQ